VLAHGHLNNQAVFVLNPATCGPLNVWDLERDEMYNLRQALKLVVPVVEQDGDDSAAGKSRLITTRRRAATANN
jgi:hypothetical protein